MENSCIIIGDKIVSSEILTECFACDYEKCGGACCVIGDSGAPILEDEIEKIENNFEKFSPLMCKKGLDAVGRKGFFEIDVDGDLVTPLVGNGQECAYCVRDDCGNNFCAIERSFCRGESAFRKPVSCRLYPIRISMLSNGMTALNLHRWNICRDAFIKGKREKIPVFRFLREPLAETFGQEFYDALEAAYGSARKL